MTGNAMTLYFAYGSNMSRALMRPRCPAAREIGLARLDGWRFMIMREGYASIVPASGGAVHGLLWRLTPRDIAALNAYERLDQGLYRTATVTVRCGARRVAAQFGQNAFLAGRRGRPVRLVWLR